MGSVCVCACVRVCVCVCTVYQSVSHPGPVLSYFIAFLKQSGLY